MKASIGVHKIIKFTIYNNVFLTSGSGVDEMLVRFPLIEQIINNASSIYFSFSVKQPHTFWES